MPRKGIEPPRRVLQDRQLQPVTTDSFQVPAFRSKIVAFVCGQACALNTSTRIFPEGREMNPTRADNIAMPQ
jgi:hypothetical protein